MTTSKEIILSQAGKAGIPVPLDKNPFRIGRTRLNHLTILGEKVSRHQCDIIETETGFKLRYRGIWTASLAESSPTNYLKSRPIRHAG